MEITEVNPVLETVDPKKCYSCGKVFKKPVDLQRHKNRRTPCLIREIAPENRLNPNRCIFCNKIFSTKGNLKKHYGNCKIKNGGMDILDEKVRYEQKIRILEEKNKARDEMDKVKEAQINQLQAQINQMQTQIKQLSVANTTNIINNVTNNTNHFHFYNFDKPFTDSVKITQDDLITKNALKMIIERMYFNKDIPENHTLYLPNLRENRLLVYKDDTWKILAGAEVNEALATLRNVAYVTGHDKINSGAIYKTDEEFINLYPVAQEVIKNFNRGENHAKCSDEDIICLAKTNRATAAKTLNSQKII